MAVNTMATIYKYTSIVLIWFIVWIGSWATIAQLAKASKVEFTPLSWVRAFSVPLILKWPKGCRLVISGWVSHSLVDWHHTSDTTLVRHIRCSTKSGAAYKCVITVWIGTVVNLLSPSIKIEHLMLILTAIVFAIRSIQWNFSRDLKGMDKCGQIVWICKYRHSITSHSKRVVSQWGQYTDTRFAIIKSHFFISNFIRKVLSKESVFSEIFSVKENFEAINHLFFS
jgi:hypothetical protein